MWETFLWEQRLLWDFPKACRSLLFPCHDHLPARFLKVQRCDYPHRPLNSNGLWLYVSDHESLDVVNTWVMHVLLFSYVVPMADNAWGKVFTGATECNRWLPPSITWSWHEVETPSPSLVWWQGRVLSLGIRPRFSSSLSFSPWVGLLVCLSLIHRLGMIWTS